MQAIKHKHEERTLRRSDKLLLNKFSQYLIPTMITYAALSLNEFVDSMLVSNLLDSDAMAIISLGMPVMLVMAAAYSLLGNGGATVYALSLGKRDHETAGRSLTCATAAGLSLGLLLLLFGYLFFGPLSRMLCHDAELLQEFRTYLRVLLLSSPLLITTLTFASFLPAAGYPRHSTFMNVVANIVNIAMDYVYIRVFGMGVEGAAGATLTGYVTAVLILAAMMPPTTALGGWAPPIGMLPIVMSWYVPPTMRPVCTSPRMRPITIPVTIG